MSTLASLWLDTTDRAIGPALEEDVHADVCVIGAGISGLSAALELSRRGAGVVVLEARFVGRRGKRIQHREAQLAAWSHLRARSNGASAARRRGCTATQTSAASSGCSSWPKSSASTVTFGASRISSTASRPTRASSSSRRSRRRAAPGCRPRWWRTRTCRSRSPPRSASPAQAEFHPLKYLGGLARALEADGVRLHEGTLATSVDAGSPCRVRTQAGRPSRHLCAVIVATHLPFLDRGLYFARCHPDAPTWSRRATKGRLPPRDVSEHRVPGPLDSRARPGWPHLVARGRGEPQDRPSGRRRALRRLDGGRASASASSRSCAGRRRTRCPRTACPSWARSTRSRERFVATGYRKWGLAMGVAAGELLAAWVDGSDHLWKELFDTRRLRPKASASSFVKENANVALRFVGDRVVKRAGPIRSSRGRGGSWVRAWAQRAAYRDESGELHALVGPLHAPRLHRELELGREDLGLSVPRLALRGARRGHHRPGGAAPAATRLTLTTIVVLNVSRVDRAGLIGAAA